MYDVIVVGARCAGAPTAMLLARKGHKVLLVDRATFPSDIPHGHFIHRHGPRRLHEWGILDLLLATGCPPITTWTHDMRDFPLVSANLIADGIPFGLGPRRTALDQVLVDAAAGAGVEFREGVVVDEFLSDGERINGIRAHRRSASSCFEERATITIGADGRNSLLAKTVQPRLSQTHEACTCWYFSYWSGVPADGLEVHCRSQSIIFAFPTNDGLFAVFVAWPASQLKTIRADIESHVMRAVDSVLGLSDRVRDGRREERFRGATDVPNFIRKPYGPGWALVGDAGCHKDPYMALGVCDAFRDADLLADAVDRGLSDASPMEVALAEYERQRDEQTEPDYHRNLHQAQFLPQPPDLIALRAAMRGNSEAASQFAMALEGMIPREAFFNPENLSRIIPHASQEKATVQA